MQTGVCIFGIGSFDHCNSRLRKRLLRIGTTKVQRIILICKQISQDAKSLIYFNGDERFSYLRDLISRHFVNTFSSYFNLLSPCTKAQISAFCPLCPLVPQKLRRRSPKSIPTALRSSLLSPIFIVIPYCIISQICVVVTTSLFVYLMQDSFNNNLFRQ